MLELRPTCENCNVSLPPDSTEAMICTFECTYCKDCVENILENVCPNCGGGFVSRPIRPAELMGKYPATKLITHKPVDMERFLKQKEKKKAIPPHKR